MRTYVDKRNHAAPCGIVLCSLWSTLLISPNTLFHQGSQPSCCAMVIAKAAFVLAAHNYRYNSQRLTEPFPYPEEGGPAFEYEGLCVHAEF